MLVLKSNVALSNTNLPILPLPEVPTADELLIAAASPSVWLDLGGGRLSVDGSGNFLTLTDRATADLYVPRDTIAPEVVAGASRNFLRFGNADHGATTTDSGRLVQSTPTDRLAASGIHTIASVWYGASPAAAPWTSVWDGGTGFGGTILGSATGFFRSAFFRGVKDGDPLNGRAFVPWQNNSNFTTFGFWNAYLGQPVATWNVSILSWSETTGRVVWYDETTTIADSTAYTVPTMDVTSGALHPVICGYGTAGVAGDAMAGDIASLIYIPGMDIIGDTDLLAALRAHLGTIKAAL